MGLRDNLKNTIAAKQKAADEDAQRVREQIAQARAQDLDVAKRSFCRLLSDSNVQEIVEYHVEHVRGLHVATVGCYHDKAVLYLDPSSNVPRQVPLDIEFNANLSVALEAVHSPEVERVIQALKSEGIVVKADISPKAGVVLVTIDYRNL